jgi:hypothetical protein
VKSTLGRQAKLRAVTRVNPEQAPKVKMWMPILPNRGEGRRASGKNRSEHRLWSTGVVGTARNESLLGNVGDSLSGRQVATANVGMAGGPGECRRGSWYL